MQQLHRPFDQRSLRSFYGQMPSSVLALGALVDGAPVGMAVSSFTNVSLEPPLVVVSIRRDSATWPQLASADVIGASMLAEPQRDHGKALSAGDADRRFDDVSHTVTESGAVVVDGAAAWFEAIPGEPIDAGDHYLILLELRSISDHADVAPLVFHRSRFAGVRHD
ncbi:flavin reductase family protein [Gordonia sp. TBRC 11910]|uniref:Flavin reductase family protein n=1 Tax=Gordonia asplenii TaxID=2725283 RepID=A0A848L3D4_9ACTN|nr:flavin reductase family protein [Gordonia asplenii]NMO03565.1 flavin reductase family protein [Gordonia asplenii]